MTGERKIILHYKVHLYSKLVSLPKVQLTDADAAIMYELAKDPDIQRLLKEDG